jgi:hypothetical protein
MMRSLSLLAILGMAVPSASIPYDQYILAPKSRTLHPVSVHSANGSVTTPEHLTTRFSENTTTVFAGEAAAAYDFGINIAGIVTLDVAAVSDAHQAIGVTFSESSLWVSNASSDATADAGRDETLWFDVDGPGRYTAARDKERGGFRYMSLVHRGPGSVEVSGAEVHYTAMPHWADDALGNYTGYFHCDGTCAPERRGRVCGAEARRR